MIDPGFRGELHQRHGLRQLTPGNIQAWIEALKRFEYVSVRGTASQRLLHEHGLERVEVVEPAGQ